MITSTIVLYSFVPYTSNTLQNDSGNYSCVQYSLLAFRAAAEGVLVAIGFGMSLL